MTIEAGDRVCFESEKIIYSGKCESYHSSGLRINLFLGSVPKFNFVLSI